MENVVLSGVDIAVVQVAIMVCNLSEIKKEILCTSASDYVIHRCSSKKQWSQIVEKKSTEILNSLRIPKQLQEKVLGIVQLAGIRMLTWAEFHRDPLGISREDSLNFLNKTFFTQQGIIDNKKAAEELMKDERLNTKQKYILACLYCFEDRIPVLYQQLMKEDWKEFYDAENPQRIQQPELVKLWSYHLMGEIDKLKGEKNLDQYRLETAVESGSNAAVEFFLEKAISSRENDFDVVAAVEESNRCRTTKNMYCKGDYSVDNLVFLLTKMGEDQLVEFLKKDVEGDFNDRAFIGDQKRSRVLEYLLNWPYQDYFMQTVGLMWDFLPERNFVFLLLSICDKIKPRKEESLKYGEERSYDYRELLREFWHQSPDRYKRYVFRNQEVDCRIGKSNVSIKPGVKLITMLLTLKNFTYNDRKNIELILASATDNEKENLISSEEWREFCMGHMEKEKWKLLNRFCTIVLPTKEKEDKFKKELCCSKESKNIFFRFIRNEKWNSAEIFIKWCCISEEEITKLKKKIIYSWDGMYACVYLISPDKKLNAVNRFIRWCFSSEEEVKTFRKDLLFSSCGTNKCTQLLEIDEDLVNEFIKFGLSSEGEIIEFKKHIAFQSGSLHCEDLISDCDLEEVCDNRGDVIGFSFKFKGGKWEQVEKFLTWCFSSEEEINDFKKNVLLKKAGTDIHFKLIESCRFEEAETFFAWLGLSTEEILKLKKDTVLDGLFDMMFGALMYCGKGNILYDDYGTREETIELLLRWYGTDRETLLEYQKYFEQEYREDVMKDLDLLIEQRLKDLDEEQIEIGRKSDTSST